MDITGREDFVESWMVDYPFPDNISYDILLEFSNKGPEYVKSVVNGVVRFEYLNRIFYYTKRHLSDVIIIGARTTPESIIVAHTYIDTDNINVVADIYDAILTDSVNDNKSLRFPFGESSSSTDIDIMSLLMGNGNVISSYDSETPMGIKKLNITMDNIDDDIKNRKFVVSKNDEEYTRVMESFIIRRNRQITGRL